MKSEGGCAEPYAVQIDLSPGTRAIPNWNFPPIDLRRRKSDITPTFLKENEFGAKVYGLCRRYGVSSGAFYNWRKKSSGLAVNEARRVRKLESENARLNKIVADQLLNMSAMKELLVKNL